MKIVHHINKLGFPSIISLALCACGSVSAPDTSKEIPSVPRNTRPPVSSCQYTGAMADITSDPAWLKEIGGPQNLQDINRVPSLMRTQATTPLYDLLLESRTKLNQKYWGYSTVDLQQLHDKYAKKFLSSFESFNNPVNETSEKLMEEYIDELNDIHTYYLTSRLYNYWNKPVANDPTLGFFWSLIPGEDGGVITDLASSSC